MAKITLSVLRRACEMELNHIHITILNEYQKTFLLFVSFDKKKLVDRQKKDFLFSLHVKQLF